MPKHAKHIPEVSVLSRSIEGRRAMLRRALQQHPDDPRLLAALRDTFEPTTLRKAAKRGVFMCYTRTDEIDALNITTDLRAAGIPVWMDEIEVPTEDDWGSAIINALRDCGLMLLILSPAARHDLDVQDECAYFLRAGKVVIPVIVEACDPGGLDLHIAPVAYFDDPEAALQQLRQMMADHPEATV